MSPILFSLFFLIVLVSDTSSIQLLQYLNLPEHDGIKRVIILTPDSKTTFSELLLKYNKMNSGLLVFLNPGTSHLTWNLETTAQLLNRRNIAVCNLHSFNADSLPGELTDQELGDVILYTAGRKYLYYGRRMVLDILSFTLKLGQGPQSSPVKLITGKLDKIAFDAVPEPKVVGFFMTGGEDLRQFQEAVLSLGPSIPFYMATDRTVAKHLRLETLGQINFVKPFSKTVITCPTNPATAADIESWLNAEKGLHLIHLGPDNLYDPDLLNENKTLFLAIGEQKSSVGAYFYRILTKILRNVTQTPNDGTIQETELDLSNVNIIWIDPLDFPTIELMIDELSAAFSLPWSNLGFHFGNFEPLTNSSVWFDTSTMNTTSPDKMADEANGILLKDWLVAVLNKTVQPMVLNEGNNVVYGGQSFSHKSINSFEIKEGKEFSLECVVSKQIGDCFWLKDGHNIGFNLDRYAGHYTWKKRFIGDCSLLIKGAKKSKDEGEWVCEVSGDASNPTIASSPIRVKILPVNSEL